MLASASLRHKRASVGQRKVALTQFRFGCGPYRTVIILKSLGRVPHASMATQKNQRASDFWMIALGASIPVLIAAVLVEIAILLIG